MERVCMWSSGFAITGNLSRFYNEPCINKNRNKNFLCPSCRTGINITVTSAPTAATCDIKFSLFLYTTVPQFAFFLNSENPRPVFQQNTTILWRFCFVVYFAPFYFRILVWSDRLTQKWEVLYIFIGLDTKEREIYPGYVLWKFTLFLTLSAF